MTQYWIGRESGICTSLVTLPFSTRWHLTPAMPQCHVPLILIYLWSNSPFRCISSHSSYNQGLCLSHVDKCTSGD